MNLSRGGTGAPRYKCNFQKLTLYSICIVYAFEMWCLRNFLECEDCGDERQIKNSQKLALYSIYIVHRTYWWFCWYKFADRSAAGEKTAAGAKSPLCEETAEKYGAGYVGKEIYKRDPYMWKENCKKDPYIWKEWYKSAAKWRNWSAMQNRIYIYIQKRRIYVKWYVQKRCWMNFFAAECRTECLHM